MRRFVAVLLLLFPVLTPSSASVETPLNIVGIKVGMPVSAAIEAIKAHNPQIKNIAPIRVEYPGLPPFFDQMTVQTQGTGDIQTEQIVVEAAPGSTNVVVGFWRQINYRMGREHAFTEILAGLKEKYGEPLMDYSGANNDQNLGWFFDAAGKPLGADRVANMDRFSQRSACNAMLSRFGVVNLTFSGRRLVEFPSALDIFPRDCGPHASSFVYAHVTRSYSNKELVKEVKVFAEDRTLMADRYKAAADTAAAYARQQKEKEAAEAAKRGSETF